MNGSQGLLFVLSGPTAVGKNSVLKRLHELEPNVLIVVTSTTRSPRPGEQHGVDYIFRSEREFKALATRGYFLEWAFVPPGSTRRYGTPRPVIQRGLAAGRDVFAQVDVQGAARIRAVVPEVISIFLAPPDLETVRARLLARGSESAEEIQARIQNAEVEMGRMHEFDYRVVNRTNELEAAVAEIRDIIHRERSRERPRFAALR